MRRLSSLAIRSSPRRRNRVSVSSSPWNLSGGGRRLLASRRQWSIASDSSPPRLVAIAMPSAPTMSPRSRSTSSANASSPSRSSRAWSWIWPLPSRRSRKQALPCPRRATMRPATRCRESVSIPAASPSCAARTSAMSSRWENSCGNGSIPASRIRSSFCLRSRRTSESFGSSLGSLIAARAYRPSGFLDFGDFEFLPGAARHLDCDHVVALATDQGFADRRLVRELLLDRVGLGRADDLEFLRVAGLLVFDVDDLAEADLVGAKRLLVDHGGATQPLFELGDPPLEQGLFVLGVVVFGVLGDVAEFARLLDPRRDLATLGRREVLDFLFQLLEALWGDDRLTTHLNYLALAVGRAAETTPRPKKTPGCGGLPRHTWAQSRGIIARAGSRQSGPFYATAAGSARAPISSRARPRPALRWSSSTTSAGARSRSVYQG